MFGIIDPMRWLALAAGIGLLVMSALYGIQTVRVSSLKADLAGERLDREKDRADTAEQLRLAERRVAARVQEAAFQQQRLADDFSVEKAALAAAAAASERDADGLRADIAAFVRSARPVGPDATPPAAPAIDRGDQSATLGELFGACDSLAGEMARAADRHAAEVRTLKRQIAADRLACEVK